jgi:predicted unusual protein kinase regulating ubiquinone biosynthesis (AarF/ABC1/UbiB family)
MYDMDRALGEPFVQVASKRQPHLIEDEVSKLSVTAFARINETVREMDKLGIYHNDIHAGNIFVQQTVTT